MAGASEIGRRNLEEGYFLLKEGTRCELTKPLSEETTALFMPSAVEAARKWRAADVVGTGSARRAEGPGTAPGPGTQS